MEKLLSDCLKPREYITDGLKRHAISHSGKKRATSSRQYIPITAGANNTPPRGAKDRRQLDYRHFILDNPKTTPPRSGKASSSSSIHYPSGIYNYRGAADRVHNISTPPISESDYQPGDYRRITNRVNATPPRSVSHSASSSGYRSGDYGRFTDGATNTNTSTRSDRNYQPGDYRRIANRMNATPPRSVSHSYYRSGDYDRFADGATTNTNTAPSSHSDYQPGDYRRIADGVNTTPSRSRSRSVYPPPIDYGPFSAESVNTITLTPRGGGNDNIRHQQHRDHRDRLVSHPSTYLPSLSLSFQEEREQALRDYKVTIEYKHLKSHAPGGVYLIPSMDSLRNFHGIIFVRRGPFTNGIFKFRLSLPPKYNDTNMWPDITFSSRVYNPYVNEETGQLDVQSAYPTWDPSRHYLVTVLTYLKKIFYSKNFADARANPAAKDLAEKDPQAYKKKVEGCVHESQKSVYINEKGSTAKFTEEEVAHRVLRDLLKHHIRSESQVTKQTVLAQIEKARKV